EHILYDGAEHVPLMTLPGMRDRTLLVNSMSKTFSVTGWRVGWVLGAPDLLASVRKVHDFLTVNAPAPLQQAGGLALGLEQRFLAEVAEHYRERRDLLFRILENAGFQPYLPKGAYYIMAGMKGFGFDDDQAFARHLVENIGVAGVPGSSFHEDPRDGAGLI